VARHDEAISRSHLLVATAEEDRLSFRWHVAHFMLVVVGQGSVLHDGPCPLRFTVSIWSSVIVSVSADGDGGRKPVRGS
jgi:hypothetical protein